VVSTALNRVSRQLPERSAQRRHDRARSADLASALIGRRQLDDAAAGQRAQCDTWMIVVPFSFNPRKV
jgi:hypothetical protein